MTTFNSKRLRTLVLFVGLFLIVGLCGYQLSYAAEHQVDLEELIQETQKSLNTNGQTLYVWWIPLEFWETSFRQTPDMSQADQELFFSIMRPYTVVAIVDAVNEGNNRLKFKKENEIRRVVELIDNNGNRYFPLDNREVNTVVTELLKKFKPMAEKLIGKDAKNIHFMVFTSQAKDDTPFLEPLKKGTFTVKLENQLFKWRLPLASLVPPKKCPTCSEILSGVYQYCPWDGTKLPE